MDRVWIGLSVHGFTQSILRPIATNGRWIAMRVRPIATNARWIAMNARWIATNARVLRSAILYQR